jgi:hypothetical protein
MPSGYNALAARPKNKLAYPGQDLVEAFTQGLGPMLYGAAKGTAATVVGLPGDIEQLARQLLLSGAAPDSYTAKNMAAQALLPTSDRVKAMLPSLSSFGAGPQAQYTENVAANLGQNIVGNIVAPKALPAVIRAGQDLPVGASIKAVGAGVPRNAAALKAAVGNEPDIIRSLLGVKEYKDTGVIPQSAIDEALMTRQLMKAQPATTPGRKASIDEWKQWGEKHGVNMTLTEPQSLGITDLTSKREIKIPGGLEGTFTIPDMFWMKANNIDPAALPKATHDALMQKLIRTHEVENPDQVDVFNRLNFALLSPNAPLTPNEFLAQRMRLTNMEELQALAGRVGEPGLSQTAQQQTGVQAAARGGMGVLGTADLKNQAMLAKLILDKPEMFQMAPGETMRDVTMRVMNQVPGLGPKTASLGTPWLNLEKANTSAVDLHMIRNSYERMLNDPLVGDAFRERMAGKLGVEPTAEAILGLPTKRVEKAAIDVIGGSSMEKKYRLASGELNAIPDVAAPGRLAYEPKQLTDFNPFYKRVVDYVDESRGPNPVLELFPEQWRKWDVYRQRLEPHEFAHPDYRSLPRQSWQEMKDSLAAHKEAGYTQARNPVMKETDWRNLYYGKVDPTLLPGLAGVAAGTGAVVNYLSPDNSR